MLFVPRLENIDREESVVIELSGMIGSKWARASRVEPMGRVAANGHEPHEWYQWYERYQMGTKRAPAPRAEPMGRVAANGHELHEWDHWDERHQWAPTSTRRAILVLGARAGKYRS